MATLVYINGSGAAACCSAASSSHEAAGIRRRATKASVASSLGISWNSAWFSGSCFALEHLGPSWICCASG